MRSFDFAVARPEPRLLVWVRRTVIAVVCVHVLLSGWSTYRRLRQVLRIDLRASSTMLAPGTIIDCDVVTSGETRNRILLELAQGSHSEVMLIPTVRDER